MDGKQTGETGGTSMSHPTHRRASVAIAVAALALLAGCVAPPKPKPAPRPTPPPSGGSQHFPTLPVGAALPSDAQCAARVRPAAEVRAGNATFNQTVGHATAPAPPYLGRAGRVTGNFRGTTDQIIQWAACKWGLDEDMARAQVAIESWWHQTTTGDFTTDSNLCAPTHPIGADGKPGQCPESIGLIQVRTQYFRPYIDDSVKSSAYNLDIGLAVWRSCFEGAETWLNTVERGRTYAAGDAWGCMGRWFSGRWYTQAANDYVARVKDYFNRRIWTTSDFIHG
jgi:autotransporter family porin